MRQGPLKVAWISEYPLEWLDDAPEPIRRLPKQHPATWMPVLAEEFRNLPEIELHVFVLRKGIDRDISFERRGVRFHVLKVPGRVRAPSLFWVDTILLRRGLARVRPDLVHAWGTERGAALVASRLNYPYVVTIQGLLTWYRELIPFDTHDKFATFLEGVSLRRARFVTTESAFAVRYLQKGYPRLSVIQAEHAPNWLFHRVGRQPQTNPVRFICVGTPNFRKGSDLLLLALNQLVSEFQFELIIVGGDGGKFVAALKPKLLPEFWRRIRFLGNLPPAEVAQELAMATIKVLPTRADTSPNAVKEAAVVGVPVVASTIGGIPDYIYPGQNGILFDSGNLAALAQALRNAMQHPIFKAGQVEPNCLAKVRDYLSPLRMRQNFWNAYQAVMVDQERKEGTSLR
jgi:glycosyltransferase involved in cell wall biosynthesis